jgi:hypothetical protein
LILHIISFLITADYKFLVDFSEYLFYCVVGEKPKYLAPQFIAGFFIDATVFTFARSLKDK